VLAGIRGGDIRNLRAIVDEFPETVSTSIRNDLVIAELRSDDLGSLNRFVAARGVYLSHLALHQRSLEDVFIELTGEPAEVGGVA